MPNLLAEFGNHLDSIPDDDSNKRHWLFGYAWEWIVKNLDQLYHDLGDEAGVEKWIREAYRKYAEPIDIPGVPNAVIEPYLDKIIENSLVEAAIAAHKALHPEAK